MDKKIVNFFIKKVIETYPKLSDIIFTPYQPLEIILHGQVQRLNISGLKKLSPFQTESIALALINNKRRLLRELITTGSCDLSHQVGNIRLRVNIFSQRTGYAIVMRKLPESIPTIEELNLPSVFKEIAKEVSGIVLFAGPTGSGKSTSIAAILEEINRNKSVHIITLEDPIEFTFTPYKSTFNQRELGTDFNDFATALRAALRQAPHVIMVGEMRDVETVKIALSAAETGHLVLSTIHATYAGQVIHRIVDMLGKAEEQFARIRLAGSLRWIICQKLLPTQDGKRLAIFEILKNTLRVQDAILGQGEQETFYDILTKGSTFGMQTFDQCLIRAYEKGIIDEDTALIHATFRSVVRRGIDQIKVKRGEITSEIEGLTVEEETKDSFELL
ncbi:MAG: PilT/PilU family type 4a pilus ATPase [Candidatus Desulfofervidaceae bacterium]|nr:PilT/PilU family type 4a pilus ATPase [Candidatus Desulfofervidaceae bacterium]MDL1969881.1 PilT/PilU family type 4a pilus ATPase [Candidatus Desulfofervidaceae bacterium]